MANRFKESSGYCDHCEKRVLVRRKDAFFQSWRCSQCGSPVETVGDGAVWARERNQAAAQNVVQAQQAAAITAQAPIRGHAAPGKLLDSGTIAALVCVALILVIGAYLLATH